jgi:membrane-bound lytic murein transglycosylase C
LKSVALFIVSTAFAIADNGFLIKNDGFDTNKVIERVEKASLLSSELEKVVEEAALRGGVDALLALSIAKVESNFNPMAVSSSNALGIMQLKMDTAVKDIYETIYPKTALPPVEILFDPKENAKLGVAYLWLIQNKYLKDIEDKEKLEYCTIAAYNAGAGTVLRTFHEDKIEATKVINALSASEVLHKLMHDMQSEQGKRYVAKVLEAKKKYRKNFIAYKE